MASHAVGLSVHWKVDVRGVRHGDEKKTIEMDTFPHIRGFTEINSLERERHDCNDGLTRNRRANVYQGKVISH